MPEPDVAEQRDALQPVGEAHRLLHLVGDLPRLLRLRRARGLRLCRPGPLLLAHLGPQALDLGLRIVERLLQRAQPTVRVRFRARRGHRPQRDQPDQHVHAHPTHVPLLQVCGAGA